MVVFSRSVGLGVHLCGMQSRAWSWLRHFGLVGLAPTVNVAEMGALEWGMGKLLSLGV